MGYVKDQIKFNFTLLDAQTNNANIEQIVEHIAPVHFHYIENLMKMSYAIANQTVSVGQIKNKHKVIEV